MPLKVKTLISSRRTKIITVSIFFFLFIIFSPFYYVNRLEWHYSQVWNTTVLTLVYTKDKVVVEKVIFLVHSVAMSAISLISVLVCTLILIAKLKNKTKWRKTSAVVMASKEVATSARDANIVKMVTLIAIIFIVCFVPGTVNFFIMAYDTKFGATGEYQNLFFSVWSVTIFLETLNSSVNFFVYMRMSSKFRDTFFQTFCHCQPGKSS